MAGSARAGSVTFNDQAVSNSGSQEVVVASVDVPDGGIVAVHRGGITGPVIGTSAYLDPATHENVRVPLDETLDSESTLVAVPYRDENDSREFEFSEDSPYTSDGMPVSDSATVVVETPTDAPTPTRTLSPTSTATNTPSPTATDTPSPTATDTATETEFERPVVTTRGGSSGPPVLPAGGVLATAAAGGVAAWRYRRGGLGLRGSNGDDDGGAAPSPDDDGGAAPSDPGDAREAAAAESGQGEAADVDDLLAAVDGQLRAAEEARADRDYERALDRCDRAIHSAESALERAGELDPDRVDAVEEQLATAREGYAATERERDAYERLQAALATAEEALEDPDVSVDDALATGAAVDDLGALVTRADDHGFDDLRDRAAALADRRTNADAGGSRPSADRSGPGPWSTVPGTPDVSVTHGEFEKETVIGRGGNADVYRATVQSAGADVAIKEPRLDGTLHSETVQRLMDEAETWDRLDDHDHVVGVVDWGADPIPWIAMEYMDDGDLAERAGDLAFDQAVWTALDITGAVRHAHRRGVAHLDLKPSNVLFREVEGGWSVPKVADWGLSKQLLDHSKSVEGFSPRYAAPEQFDDAHGSADDITDVYQLGAVLYELFTGRPPFEGGAAQVMRKVLAEEPTPPSEVADLPQELDDILLTALATEKDDRYESVLYLRDDLQGLLED